MLPPVMPQGSGGSWSFQRSAEKQAMQRSRATLFSCPALRLPGIPSRPRDPARLPRALRREPPVCAGEGRPVGSLPRDYGRYAQDRAPWRAETRDRSERPCRPPRRPPELACADSFLREVDELVPDAALLEEPLRLAGIRAFPRPEYLETHDVSIALEVWSGPAILAGAASAVGSYCPAASSHPTALS